MIWLVIRAIVWVGAVLAAVVLTRLATILAAFARRPPERSPRWGGRWLFGWLVLIPAGLAVVYCEAGGFYGFHDPAGGDWEFEGRGWPLTIREYAAESSGDNSAMKAIYWLAIIVDLLCALALLAAVRLLVDRWLAAWDAPRRWPALAREAAGWSAALVAILLCEPLAARPLTLPGTELIVYSTLIYEPPELRAGILFSLASIVYLTGLGMVRGWRTLKRLREEGVV